MLLLSSFEFLTLGGVFTGVKNDSMNFVNKKNIRLFRKILSKWTLFIRKVQKFWCSYELLAMSRMENYFQMPFLHMHIQGVPKKITPCFGGP